MTSSSRRSSGPVLPVASAFRRSRSPSRQFFKSEMMSPDFPSGAGFYSQSSTAARDLFRQQGSTSPTRVHLHGLSPPPQPPSVRFSIDRSGSPGRRSVAVRGGAGNVQIAANRQKRTCLCSPTSHPGSFRCALHKNERNSSSVSYSPNRLNMRRSAMTNSLVRIGTVEGDLVKRALAALIRPSSHQQRRRADFRPRPSRLSVMSKA